MIDSEQIIYRLVSLLFLMSGGIFAMYKTGFLATMAIHGCALIPLFVLGAIACMVIAAVYLANLASQESIRWPAKLVGVLPLVVVLAVMGYFAYRIASA